MLPFIDLIGTSRTSCQEKLLWAALSACIDTCNLAKFIFTFLLFVFAPPQK